MGYRSDVGLAITNQGLTELIEEDINLTNLIKDGLSDVDEHLQSDDCNHLFVWTSIKWDDSFADVAAIQKRLREIDSSCFRFIRIGENISDIEEAGTWYNNDFEFGYTRQLSFNR